MFASALASPAMLSAAVLCLALLASGAYASYDINEDIRLETVGLLEKYGYPAETHFVTTDDGYILQLHRVPYSPTNPPKDGESPRTPVLLMHGLLSSSADWVVMGPGQGFAYLLADAGYDVWMGNSRGNFYSRNHTSYNPSRSKFWKFTWHEMGTTDLPAVIDFILGQTGFEQLFYVGHSQGTTQFFVMGAERPEYNAKIRTMFALAPVAYMGHMTSPFLQLIALANKPLGTLMLLMGMNEFLPNNELMTIGGQLLCRDSSIFQAVCENVLFLIAGYNSAELNSTMLPVILGHTPAGASTRQLLHYAQEITSYRFRQYDHGAASNLITYGRLTPPKYDTKKITAPISLHYSSNDWLAAVRDVDQLYKELPNSIGKFLVPDSKWNHLDFLWGIHAKEQVYDKVISLMLRN